MYCSVVKIALAVVLLLSPLTFAEANSRPQSAPNVAPQSKNGCGFSQEEIGVYQSQLSRDTSKKRPMVVMATTVGWIDDIDSFNLPLAAQGHAIPADVRADFMKKNKTGCLIQPFGGVQSLRFMSSSEEQKVLANEWGEFLTKYGKHVERIAISRVGFNSDKSLALLHVLYASSGELYLLERKNGHWQVKFYVQTMAT